MSSYTGNTQNITFQTAHITDSKQPETRGAQIACLVIAYVGVALRFLARRLAKAQITSDDYIIVFALVMHLSSSDEPKLLDRESLRLIESEQGLYTAAVIDGFICMGLGVNPPRQNRVANTTGPRLVSGCRKA